MPSPVEALPCGSRSITRTRSPIAARAVPRLIAVVVLPTPPFWLAMAKTRTFLSSEQALSGTAQPPDMDNATPRIAEGLVVFYVQLPEFSSVRQFTFNVFPL